MRKLFPQAETVLVIGLGLLVLLTVAHWTIAASQQVAGARGKAGATACANNLHYLSIAVDEYTQDYDETLPPMQTQSVFQTAVLPYSQHSTDFVCPDTGLSYIPNAAISGQVLLSLGRDTDAIEVARDAAAHEDGEMAIVYLDGVVRRDGLIYSSNPDIRVANSAKQLALVISQYEQDYDEKLPPMDTTQNFQTALSDYVPDTQIYSTPTGSPFIPNAALNHADLSSITDPATTVLFQDTPPYVGGHPTIAYADGHVTHAFPAQSLLWANTDGTASVWNLRDAQPDQTCALYGPYSRWTPQTLVQGPNGSTRLLWTNTDGRAALWNLADAHPDATCVVYGPYPGWTAKAMAVGPDNAVHLLWDNVSGEIALWNTADADPTATCLLAGPYDGWHGKAISIGPDNHERVLWANTNGMASVWNLADANPVATCVLAGPYSGWTAQSLAVGADNAAYLLWDNVSGQVSVWDLKDLYPSDSCLLFGPYNGWSGSSLTIGLDTTLRLQWNCTDGRVSLWNLDDLQPDTTYHLYGPYKGWAAQP